MSIGLCPDSGQPKPADRPVCDACMISRMHQLYVTAPSTILTSNTTSTYTSARHSRIRTERITNGASAPSSRPDVRLRYEDNRRRRPTGYIGQAFF
jgi:hypothetical protein